MLSAHECQLSLAADFVEFGCECMDIKITFRRKNTFVDFLCTLVGTSRYSPDHNRTKIRNISTPVAERCVVGFKVSIESIRLRMWIGKISLWAHTAEWGILMFEYARLWHLSRTFVPPPTPYRSDWLSEIALIKTQLCPTEDAWSMVKPLRHAKHE